MYESHFGISGLPFRLSPDPDFYFDSAGHHRALVDLRRGLTVEEGLAIVTGEIGAGKTTLVRTVLAERAAAGQSEAHICSTQLDAEELVAAIAMAFGLETSALDSKACQEALEGFLQRSRAEGRQPVLIIDEAQNLQRSAFEFLLRLVLNAGDGPQGLRVCLIGQPELRDKLNSGDLTHFRQHVTALCHLGPLDRAEAGPYIEHRLRKVGWSGRPSFAAGTYEEIHRCTAGIPRRINTLCNRLLMSCFLSGGVAIDADAVTRTASDMRAEIGVGDLSGPFPVGPDLPAAARGRVDASRGSAEPSDETLRTPQAPVWSIETSAEPLRPIRTEAPLLCLADGHGDHIKAAALMRAFAGHPDLPPACLVRIQRNDALMLNLPLFTGTQVLRTLVSLDIDEVSREERIGLVEKRFEAVLDNLKPSAVVVFGGDAGLACTLVASRKAIPVIRIGAGRRSRDASSPIEVTDMLIDQFASLLLPADDLGRGSLLREGLAVESVRPVGHVAVDSLHFALKRATGAASSAKSSDAVRDYLVDRHGYALVSISHFAHPDDRPILEELVLTLRDVSRDLPVIWPVHSEVDARLDQFRLNRLMAGERIACVPFKSFLEFIGLLQNATCVLTDSDDLQVECRALGVSCLSLAEWARNRPADSSAWAKEAASHRRTQITRAVWECIFNGNKRSSALTNPDGQSSGRVAEVVAQWLASGTSLEAQSSSVQTKQRHFEQSNTTLP